MDRLKEAWARKFAINTVPVTYHEFDSEQSGEPDEWGDGEAQYKDDVSLAGQVNYEPSERELQPFKRELQPFGEEFRCSALLELSNSELGEKGITLKSSDQFTISGKRFQIIAFRDVLPLGDTYMKKVIALQEV